jgi:hypothetical protein
VLALKCRLVDFRANEGTIYDLSCELGPVNLCANQRDVISNLEQCITWSYIYSVNSILK